MPFRTVQIDIDDASFQAALNRASAEGKAIGQVVVDCLTRYGQRTTPSPKAAPQTYTVQSGDTLGKIANKFYNDPHKYPVIQRANNIADAGRIFVGQVLIIPSLSDSSTTTIHPVSPAPSPSPSAPVVPTAPPVVPSPEVTPTPTREGEAPAKPSIQWVGSPNFNDRFDPENIWAIVIHATANSSLQGVVDWFNNPNAQVSAHYSIGKDGKIVQHVKDSSRAWHAGRSIWKGHQSVNDFSLGIELVNLNNGQDPYPEEQHQANVALCAYLCYKYNVNVDNIMGHLDIAIPPGRKSDPRGYDLDRLRREVTAVLGD